MQHAALAAYERSLAARIPLHVRHRDGRTVRLDVERWLAPADATDLDVVRRTVSPVLDVGCGPGRIVAALADHGRIALGIDIAQTAVRLAESRGVAALRRDVFAPLPAERRWATVLLLDGNVGIGGDVDRLLTRVRHLLAPRGRAVIETHPDAEMSEAHAVRFVLAGEPVGPEFPWCYVGSLALRAAARRCGLTPTDVVAADGRTFVTLAPMALEAARPGWRPGAGLTA